MTPTLPCRGASARTTTFGSMTLRRSPCAAAMPANASSTTASGALMSFFMGLRGHEVVRDDRVGHEGGHHATDDRGDDRDPRIAPVGVALAGNRQDGVRDARRQVTGRVDRIPRRAAE